MLQPIREYPSLGTHPALPIGRPRRASPRQASHRVPRQHPAAGCRAACVPFATPRWGPSHELGGRPTVCSVLPREVSFECGCAIPAFGGRSLRYGIYIIFGLFIDMAAKRWSYTIKDFNNTEWLHLTNLNEEYFYFHVFGIDNMDGNADIQGFIHLRNRIRHAELQSILGERVQGLIATGWDHEYQGKY